MPPLAITSRTLDNAVTLTVAGEIDLSNAENLYKALTEALAPGAPVIVDLSGVGFMDSRGLAALVRARHEALDGATVPILLITSDAVARVIEIAGAEGILPVYRDQTEALMALAVG